MRLEPLFCLFIPRKNRSPSSVVNVTTPSGHRGARASAESSTSGPVKPNSTEDCLAGAVAPPPEGSDETNLNENPSSLSPDDPQIWGFTLDRFEDLGVAAGSIPRGDAGPVTPRSHAMQTRSKTPQSGPGRPPGDTAPHTRQEQGQSRPQHPNRSLHGTGEGWRIDLVDH